MPVETCARCKAGKKKLPKVMEVIFFLQVDDNEKPVPPLVMDLTNKGLYLCSQCLGQGAIPELVEEIKRKAGIVQKPGLSFQIVWGK